jgi:hypothetical protein
MADTNTSNDALRRRMTDYRIVDNIGLQRARDCIESPNGPRCNNPVMYCQGIEGLTITGNRQVLPANGQPWATTTGSTNVVNTNNQFT